MNTSLQRKCPIKDCNFTSNEIEEMVMHLDQKHNTSQKLQVLGVLISFGEIKSSQLPSRLRPRLYLLQRRSSVESTKEKPKRWKVTEEGVKEFQKMFPNIIIN
jgi:hypothetical protein